MNFNKILQSLFGRHNKKQRKKARKRTANAVRPLARYGVNLCPYEHYPKGWRSF